MMKRQTRPTRCSMDGTGSHRRPTPWMAVLMACVLAALVAAPAGAQEVVVGFTATVDELSFPLHSFGFRTLGDSGIDGYDLVEPPLPPDDYIAGHFRMSHLIDGEPGRWRRDIRGSHDFLDQTESWELILESSRTGVVCVLEFLVELGDASALLLNIDLPDSQATIAVPGTYALDLDAASTALTLTLIKNPVSTVSAPWVGLQLRNAPNPFNPSTLFEFDLPERGDISLRIYDAQGACVRRLSGGVMEAGPQAVPWDGKGDDGRRVASGVYFYRLSLDARQLGETKKMTLLK